MTKDEELQALREENRILKALVAKLLPLKEQLAEANARIAEAGAHLAVFSCCCFSWQAFTCRLGTLSSYYS